ncbi:MAG: DNA gyrase inhibitor YacG [Bryobacterales bacterium]|nr:DNA gyrase inhibitor YacG [Bryobacterales bacterium]
MSSKKTIPCPICKKPVALAAPELPFCSKRCQLIDLGMWSDEEYRIVEPLNDFDAEGAPQRDDD